VIGSGPPPDRVPTLTEVVILDNPPTGHSPFAPSGEADVMGAGVTPPPAAFSGLSEDQVVQRVLADVQRQVDLMLEYRLREVLAPILTRAADAVIREARAELASTLRDVVARAVTQELSRHRSR
jgi:hypothetical protein